MTINLSSKERKLLEDQKKHEEICVQKYNNYAQQAKDPALKQIFENNAAQEQQHYDSIKQILSGQVPQMGGQSQQAKQSQAQATQTTMQGSMSDASDAALCDDMLMTEKYVSSSYDTTIFESCNSAVREVLNHLQKEEQQHGEAIFNYMQSHGMYNPE